MPDTAYPALIPDDPEVADVSHWATLDPPTYADETATKARGRVRARPYIREGHPVSGYEQTRDLVGEVIRGATRGKRKGRKGQQRPRKGWLEYAKEARASHKPIRQFALRDEYGRRMRHEVGTEEENRQWFENTWFAGPHNGGRYETISADPGPAFEEQHAQIMEVGARIDAELAYRIKPELKRYTDLEKRYATIERDRKRMAKESDKLQYEIAAEILVSKYGWDPDVVTADNVEKRYKAYHRAQAKLIPTRTHKDEMVLDANADVWRAMNDAAFDHRIVELDDQRWALIEQRPDAELRQATADLTLMRRAAVMKMLREIRPFGGDVEASADEDTSLVALEGAERWLPSDWIASSNGHPSDLEVLTVNTRGKYMHRVHNPVEPFVNQSRILITSDKQAEGMAPGEPTMLHELVHRAEATHDGITGAEWTFYWSRVSPGRNRQWEEPKKLSDVTGRDSYEEFEVTRPDDFANFYSGKTYGDKMDSAYEILTMGIEDLIAGGHGTMLTDDEYRQFVLGMLALA